MDGGPGTGNRSAYQLGIRITYCYSRLPSLKVENKGIVLKYEKEKRLIYTHLSSLSRLPDKQENYSTLEFILTPTANHTLLTLNIENFATELIRKHLEFYWKTTLNVIKENVENHLSEQ